MRCAKNSNLRSVSCTVSKISWITRQILLSIAGVPLFNALVRGELPKLMTTKDGVNELETWLYRMV